MSTKSIPDGYDALIPSLIVRDAAKAIDFYKEVLGATEMMRMNYPQSNKIVHAEIKIRDHVLMLGDENPQMGAVAPQPSGGPPPASGMVSVPGVAAPFNRALAKGVERLRPRTD